MNAILARLQAIERRLQWLFDRMRDVQIQLAGLRQARLEDVGGGGSGGGGSAQNAICRATSIITAAAGNTPGTGTMTFEFFDGITITDTTETSPVFNITDMNVADGAYFTAKLVEGNWWIDNVDSCSHLS